MSRVINTNSQGKARNQMMRTAAELLRRLSQKSELDDDVKNMTAMLALCLREIEDGIEASAESWEKRDYWMKAEHLRQRWGWASNAALDLETLVRQASWEQLPAVVMVLLPHFADIKVTKFTRDPDTWRNAYEQLCERLDM